MLIFGPNVSAAVGGWSLRVKGALPFREAVLIHEVVEAVDIVWVWPERELYDT